MVGDLRREHQLAIIGIQREHQIAIIAIIAKSKPFNVRTYVSKVI